ncbi:MAG: hypothetical protein DRI57_19645 [Deltaproteobacteria bacterium]|nr:MAG: hypothetical protein DRI57_19645 [Deltaproteobacteria bacterium]
MKKMAILIIPLLVIILAAPNHATAAVLVGGKEIRTSVTRSGSGGSRDIFYSPYSGIQPASHSTGSPGAGYMAYQVRPGDTLAQIALTYLGNSTLAYPLAAYNGIRNPNQIQAGQTILIPKPRIGLQYKIELMRSTAGGGCELLEVDDNFVFRSGDQFRMRVKSNINGYLYIFNQGSSNRKHLIFPDPRVLQGRNYLKAYREYTVPASGWFQFDNRPGTERLILVESLKPVSQFAGFSGQGSSIVSPDQIYAIPLNPQQWQLVSNRISSIRKSARDIFLAYDYTPSGASDTSTPQSGFISQTMNTPNDLFTVEISLRHR